MAAEQPRSDVGTRLHSISQRLRETPHLGPEARQELAALVDELAQALDSSAVPSAEKAHLTESTAHLLQALQQRQDTSLLTTARERLDQAILNAEAHAPFAAGIARRLVEALADLGI